MDKKTIAKNVKEKLSGIKQADLVRGAGISQSRISDICNGFAAPTLQQAAALADYLHVSLDDLIGRVAPDRSTNTLAGVFRLLRELYDTGLFTVSVTDRGAEFSVSNELLQQFIYEGVKLHDSLDMLSFSGNVLDLWRAKMMRAGSLYEKHYDYKPFPELYAEYESYLHDLQRDLFAPYKSGDPVPDEVIEKASVSFDEWYKNYKMG